MYQFSRFVTIPACEGQT